eukprot:CAMPEP_0174288670 /NCGR_PEP_ID=MMETSP0809-20121228/21863_1 /TAXON_ID=73025 ORGANISM="Eutreptiella gymnastica-like, Strain CCMP1594" /NCGR_SAMPLE_ID=MMETSP0809 /ASSEMBLY_ACC=CAM_ASM_000658 /LENGTH=346 /DNA_ID=CAMNT_0015386065 /DNA_START=148 /DNA_END=1188 /DNA_ORIENTATION=-
MFFRSVVHGRPQPWRQEKQVPPNPTQLKWQWEPEHIPTAEEYEMFPEVVTLFGGDTNPLQKYVIDELAKTPEVSTVRVGTLFPDEFAANLPAAWLDKVVAEYVDITDQHSVLAASEGSQALVNMFDIPYEVELSFYDAHVGASKIISHAANTVFASRVIQVSSLASRVDSWSRYSESKFRGEDIALACFPWTTIMRFGPLFGKDSASIEQFKQYMTYAPFYPCPASKTQIQPTFAGDAAKAIVAALGNPHTRELQYDLGGPQTYSHAELVKEVMKLKKCSRPVIPVPAAVGDAIVAGLQWLPDPLVTRDMVYLIRSHNVTNHELMRSWKDLMPSHQLKTLEEAIDL